MYNEHDARQGVLDALLGRSPLPGGVQPLVFPDTPDIVTAPSVLLVVAPEDPELRLPQRVRPGGEKAIRRLAGETPQTPVLRFLPPEAFADRLGVRLQVSASDDQGQLLPLGEIVATFASTADGDLTVSEPTHVVAY